MRVLVATDAWHPQVNGVVRTLTSLKESAAGLGVTINFLTYEGFPTIPAPSYPGLRLALPSPLGISRRIAAAAPDAIHIATEGPIGHMVRRYCINRGLPFTTSYTTRFPEYIAARLRIPASWSYAVLRRFHAAATVTMVSTPSLMAEFEARGFTNLGLWTRGVDTALFSPAHAINLDLPRPIFVSVGRVVHEKNLEAFLSLDLPGTKVVIGQGPEAAALQRRFPEAKFLGLLDDQLLAAHLAAADAFVFPSRTDTFGVVQLEALACGLPIAAFPVTVRATSLPATRSGSWTRTCVSPAWGRCAYRGRRAAPSRSPAPGSTARGSSSPTSTGSISANPASRGRQPK